MSTTETLIVIIASAAMCMSNYLLRGRIKTAQAGERGSFKFLVKYVARAMFKGLRETKFIIVGACIGFIITVVLGTKSDPIPVAIIFTVYLLSWLALSIRDYAMGVTARDPT